MSQARTIHLRSMFLFSVFLLAGLGCSSPSTSTSSLVTAVVGPEFPLDTRVVASPDGPTNGAGIGYCNGNFLVFWPQGRAARVRASDGMLLDPVSILVERNPPLDSGSPPRTVVACDGINFILFGIGKAWRLHATTGELTPLASPGGFATSFASNGTNLLFVYNATSGIKGRFVGLDGALIGTDFDINTSTTNPSNPSVTFDGTNYFVAWEDNRTGQSRDVFGTRVTPTGTVLDGVSTGIQISSRSGDQTFARVASDGTNIVVMWSDPLVSGVRPLLAARVRKTDGVVLDTPIASGGIPINTVAGMQSGSSSKLTFDGTNFLATWGTSGRLHGNRIQPSNMALLDGNAASGGHTFAFGGENIAYGDAGTYLMISGAFGTRVRASDLAELDGPPVPQLEFVPSNKENRPTVGYTNGIYLVAWADNRMPAGIYGVRVKASDGAILDNPAFRIHSDNSPTGAISVGAGNGIFLVGYEEVLMRIRASDGALLEPPGGIAQPRDSSTDCIGDICLVASREIRDPILNYREIRGRRLRASDGMFIDSSFQVISANRTMLDVEVVPGASKFLVVGFNQDGLSTYGRNLGALVDASSGAVTSLSQLASPTDMSGINGAFDGTNFMVAYAASLATNIVRGARIRESDGMLFDSPEGFAITSPITSPFRMLFDGTNFVLVSRAVSGGRVFYQRLMPDGTLLDTPVGGGGIDITSGSLSTDAAGNGAGQMLVAYDRFVSDDDHRIDRVFARLVTTVESGGMVDAGTDASIDSAPDMMAMMPDAAPDAAPDAMPDAASDAAPDAMPDAMVDAGLDALLPADAATDATVADGSVIDAPADSASIDASQMDGPANGSGGGCAISPSSTGQKSRGAEGLGLLALLGILLRHAIRRKFA